MGFREIAGVDTALDNFTFSQHGLNCFTVPKYLATNAFAEGNRELFYLYVYLLTHYNLVEIQGMEALERYMLEEKLGLELLDVDAGEDVVRSSVEAIDQGRPAFMPVCRGDLFYVREFRKDSQPHMILIKGYNPATEVFVVMDGQQNHNLLESGEAELRAGLEEVGLRVHRRWKEYATHLRMMESSHQQQLPKLERMQATLVEVEGEFLHLPHRVGTILVNERPEDRTGLTSRSVGA